ncbi:MAG: twin-arginine translocation signal domain-containing protein [Planctomycetales bacterium]|nr:twin-arginine translocation signal domain-containing protein [Planctomycetales bacterium]
MTLDRRDFIQTTAAVGGWLTFGDLLLPAADDVKPSLKVAPFRIDASPPEGHPLCGGWIKPVVGMDDPEEAIGFVLLGAGQPIVICAVDWTGILNEAHIEWRTVLAQAAGTTPDRVAVQCVHQHNAPFACLDAERIVAAQGDLPHVVDAGFHRRCCDRTAAAITAALKSARPVTHIATGQAKVEKVAGNRRFLGPDGKVIDWRGSSSKNPVHKELPEGLIDPWLKTVAFYDGETKLVACHYYATHPMSYYGDGRVSSDFVGLARKKRQADEPGCTHIYFTGCSGNIAAGKYNDGTPEARVALTGRIYDGIVASEKELVREAISQVSWRTAEVFPSPRATFNTEALEKEIANKNNAVAGRIRPAMMLSWLRRCERKVPIVLSALHVNNATLLHMPAESFVEYQLHAQQSAPHRFVATAAYGDGGPWYIPVREAYPQGGYEVSVAFCEPTVEDVLKAGMEKLL